MMTPTDIRPTDAGNSVAALPLGMLWVVTLVLFVLACTDSASHPPQNLHSDSKLLAIDSQQQFDAALEAAGQRLLVFDFHADWCYPCKELEPVLEKIARDTAGIRIYKIDYDRQQPLAQLFKVRGLPTVVFVKNHTIVYTLMGLHPEETYRQAIDSFSQNIPRSATPSTSLVTPVPQPPEQRSQTQ